MPTSLEVAQTLWKSALDKGEVSPPFFKADMEACLDVLLQVPGCNIDSRNLAHMVLGDAPGGSLLSMTLWQTGLGEIAPDCAALLVEVLLSRGANPNALVNGHKPVDMFVAGIHNAQSDSAQDIERMVELLVASGMNHKDPGAYTVEQLGSYLSKAEVPDSVIVHMLEGPNAVLLDRATDSVARLSSRRTL